MVLEHVLHKSGAPDIREKCFLTLAIVTFDVLDKTTFHIGVTVYIIKGKCIFCWNNSNI